MKTKPRFAVIGNMQQSRRVSARSQVGRRVEEALRTVNQKFAAAIWAPLKLTQGIGEFSGVMEEPQHAFDALVLLNLLVHPLRFKIGLGCGTIDKLVRERHAGRMDGPAFHAAAAALARAQGEHLPFAIALPDLSASEAELRAIEALASLHDTLRSGWTPAVIEIARARAAEGAADLTQHELARRLKRTQQAISGAERRGHFRELGRAESAIRQMLARLHPAGP